MSHIIKINLLLFYRILVLFTSDCLPVTFSYSQNKCIVSSSYFLPVNEIRWASEPFGSHLAINIMWNVKHLIQFCNTFDTVYMIKEIFMVVFFWFFFAWATVVKDPSKFRKCLAYKPKFVCSYRNIEF